MSEEVRSPPPEVSPALFRKWQLAERGASPRQLLTNPVWTWLFRDRVDPYTANSFFEREDACPVGPRWSGSRMGQSVTVLADGREFWIAGEYEDFYDPDFFIYNDVIVKHPDGSLEIFGYPSDNFPPTDFHSATALEDESKIVVVGSIGYQEGRVLDGTQVMLLDTDSKQIDSVETTGVGPGWIHKHTAELTPDGSGILVSGGQVDRGSRILPNIDDWCLHFSDWCWEQLTDHQWQRVAVRRCDGKSLHLWEMRSLTFARETGRSPDSSTKALTAKIGMAPDLTLFGRLYVPSIDHSHCSNEGGADAWNVVRLLVDGTVVSLVEDLDSILVTVEGELRDETIENIARELCDKLGRLENTPCELEWIRP